MGVGALYVSPNAPFDPFMNGGGQERRKRAGTLNVAGIAGFGAALSDMSDLSHTEELRDYLEAELKRMEPELVVFGERVSRLPNTSYFAVPDTPSATLMMALDLAGVSVSTGMACSYNSTSKDVDHFLTAWTKIRRKSHNLKGAA